MTRPMHVQDEDCAAFLVDDQCTACGVSHTGDCPCGGRGFHRPGCLLCDETRDTLARKANEAASLSRRGGAPVLAADSGPETIARWLQWNDPNGCHTAELAAAEDIEPYDEERAWEALAEMLEGI